MAKHEISIDSQYASSFNDCNVSARVALTIKESLESSGLVESCFKHYDSVQGN